MATVKKNVRVGSRVLQCRLENDNRLILLIDGGTHCVVRVINSQTQESIDAFKVDLPPKHAFDFHSASDALIVYNYPVRSVDVYSLKTHKKTAAHDTQPFHIEVSAIGVSHDGSLFAVGDTLGNCTIWSAGAAAPIGTITDLGGAVTTLAFSEDKTRAAFGLSNGAIHVTDVANTANINKLDQHRDSVNQLLFCGKRLVSADTAGFLAVWNIANWRVIKVLQPGVVMDTERSFDGRGVLFACQSGQIALGDMEDAGKSPLIIDTLGEALVQAAFNDQTGQMIAATASGNLLFFLLHNDTVIDDYFAKPKTIMPTEQTFTVIVVDDSITMRRVISAAVKNDYPNAIVKEASNGKEAIALLAANPETKVMFLDWNMPTMSGEDVVREIHSVKLYPQLNIIMATTEGGQEKVVQMLKLGVAGYLVKPFRKESIQKIMSKLLERIR